jgi:DNA-binding CsgD family transcriptional regulator
VEVALSEVIYQALCAAFDHLSTAVFILRPDGFILFANHAAKVLLEEGGPVRSSEGYLRGKDRAASDELSRGIEAVLSSTNREHADTEGYELCLSQSPGETQGAIGYLRVLSNADEAAPVIALFITRIGEGGTYGISALAESFGLSKAETRVLEQLIEAQTPSGVAARLNISVSTVKSHMRKIFQKTGTSRQTDLLRLVERFRVPLRNSRSPKDYG